MTTATSDRAQIRRCGSCGATLEHGGVDLSREAISTTCGYCGSQLVDSNRGAVVVDRVAPFRIPRKAAEARLRAHLAGQWWVDSGLRKAARSGRVDARELRGVLVPFFAYTASVRGTYRARIGIDWYREETVETKSKGKVAPIGGVGDLVDSAKTETRRVRETEWFDLRGSAVDELDDHLVEASVGLRPDEARRLLPFDLGQARVFDPRLLAGWQAELPSRTRAEVDAAARKRIRDYELSRLEVKLLPGDRRRVEHFDCDIQIHRVQLVMLPVWIASVQHGGRIFRLLVHGQDGRCFGKAPLARGKIIALVGLGLLLLLLLILWRQGVLPWM